MDVESSMSTSFTTSAHSSEQSLVSWVLESRNLAWTKGKTLPVETPYFLFATEWNALITSCGLQESGAVEDEKRLSLLLQN